jgi:membrane-bound serine protease (ClpP class)
MRVQRLYILAFAVLCFCLAAGLKISGAEQRILPSVRIAGPINPVVAQFLVDELDKAGEARSPAFLLEIDTPGGLDSSMRKIIQSILASQVPVIVYVAPAGARAASAGALIALAADFVAMAPGTNIGAATPVSIGLGGDGQSDEMKAKVHNDAVAYARSLAEQRGRNLDWAERIVRDGASTAATEALELKVIDLVAADRSELLTRLDGQRYLRKGQAHYLDLAGVELVFAEMNWRQQILNTISNPNVAYLLMMLGIIGIFFEISQPGVILPGVVGAIAILLALFAFQSLPVNYAGALLILLALVLFILEVKVTSYGMLTVGGVLALALGSLMLIDSSAPYLQISRAVITATVAMFTGFFLFCMVFVVRVQRSRSVSGLEAMIGELGQAVTAVNRAGRVFVHGEYWDAVADAPVEAGQTIEVVAMAPMMRLQVRAVPGSPGQKDKLTPKNPAG